MQELDEVECRELLEVGRFGRIAEVATELGLQRVIRTGPADAGIIAALSVYNWQS